ncbi:MAG: hypothetical protein II230_05955, partial [Clostridia bacterium]|nr:hypothetical protein [Clostridia bacterium]
VKTATPIANMPGVAYTMLQNADGKGVGVLFTYPDGSTYQWDCPIASPLYIEVSQDQQCFSTETVPVKYYAEESGWLFDWLDLQNKTLLYRHVNEPGKALLYNCDFQTQNEKLLCECEIGLVHLYKTEFGEVQSEYVEWPDRLATYVEEWYMSSRRIDIRQVLPLTEADRVPIDQKYHTLAVDIPVAWTALDADGAFHCPFTSAAMNIRPDEPYLRMTGIDTLYYSETPIEPLTEKNICNYYADAVGRDVTFEIKPNICRVWRYKGGGEGEVLAKETYIIRIDAHYLAIMEGYSYYSDASLYSSLVLYPILRSCLYY